MGYRIKEIREKRNLTQEDLARESGVSRATISALENGVSRATTTKTLMNIARALGVSIEDLFLRRVFNKLNDCKMEMEKECGCLRGGVRACLFTKRLPQYLLKPGSPT